MSHQRSVVTGIIPCATVILTASAGELRDAMTATAVFVSEVPPLLSISVAEHVLTRELIDRAGEFVVNLATPEQLELVRKLGATHGREVDKLKEFQVPTEPSEKVAGFRIRDTYATLECRVVASHRASTYRVYLAEIAAHTVDTGKSPLVWHEGRFFSLANPIV